METESHFPFRPGRPVSSSFQASVSLSVKWQVSGCLDPGPSPPASKTQAARSRWRGCCEVRARELCPPGISARGTRLAGAHTCERSRRTPRVRGRISAVRASPGAGAAGAGCAKQGVQRGRGGLTCA